MSGSSGFSSSTTTATFSMHPAISAGSESSARRTTSSKLIYSMMSASSAFCACRRFSAWSQTADCGP